MRFPNHRNRIKKLFYTISMFRTMYVEIHYLINIRGQYINIHEVMDFHGGFLTIFSALRSHTRWTTQLMNIYICVGNI